MTAARLLNSYGTIENFAPGILGNNRELALLFKTLATLRSDAALFRSVDELRWQGPTPAFAEYANRIGATRLLERSLNIKVASDRGESFLSAP